MILLLKMQTAVKPLPGAIILNISSPIAINAYAIVTSDYNGEDVSCNGSSDGEITIALQLEELGHLIPIFLIQLITTARHHIQ